VTALTAGLHWDTEFFGFPIGRVCPDTDDFAAAAAEADGLGYRCTYLLVEGGRGRSLLDAQTAGFVTVSTRVELQIRALAPELCLDGRSGAARPAEPEADLEWARELARTRFGLSRFYTDPGFGHDRAGRLFEAWVDRGFADPERHVIVLDDAGGFVICGSDPSGGEGVIDLIATAGAPPGGGGAVLIAAAHRWFLNQGLQTASVVTQSENIAALRLYEKAGYRTRSFGYWLHRWARDSVDED